MATNPYFSQAVRSEQTLYEDIVIESLKMYGQDIYYLPRDIVNEDRILGDDVPSRFNSSYKIEMYIDNVDGFDGEGDLFSKFGVEIRDQATFVVSRRRWNQTIQRYDNEITVARPAEGDLLYIPFSSKLFQITHVEHEMPFYQLANLPTYKLRCELFEYNDEDFDTGVNLIDDIEQDYAYKFNLVLDSDSQGFVVGEIVNQTLADGTIMSGEVASYNPDTNILGVIHAGANDGKFHNFITGTQIVGTTDYDDREGFTSFSIALVTAVTEDNQIAANEQNEYFDTLTDFLDFSESNPFGDPS
tara:strand:+ start:267 stop:1169 length:903 start_codon:yes stop_codon:yes gene_type:complete